MASFIVDPAIYSPGTCGRGVGLSRFSDSLSSSGISSRGSESVMDSGHGMYHIINRAEECILHLVHWLCH